MAYRSGTYVAFHAAGSSDPTASDMKYYSLMRAWTELKDTEFSFVNSHDKSAAVRDSISRQRLRDVLAERLRNSKNMVLILGQTTRFDTDWVPFEISYAVDTCKIPIIAAYPGYEYVLDPKGLAATWPFALSERIWSGVAHVIHVPFKRTVLSGAIRQFSPDSYPLGNGLGWYSREAYASFGVSIR
jgi:hypothetical protein